MELLTKNLPDLNVPALQLAQKAEVERPVIDLTARLTSWLHDVDYARQVVAPKKDHGIEAKMAEPVEIPFEGAP